MISMMDDSISYLASSISLAPLHFISSAPAMAYSSPGAEILIPIAPLISLWCMYSALTLISFIGCGVKRALTCVTMAPLKP